MLSMLSKRIKLSSRLNRQPRRRRHLSRLKAKAVPLEAGPRVQLASVVEARVQAKLSRVRFTASTWACRMRRALLCQLRQGNSTEVSRG